MTIATAIAHEAKSIWDKARIPTTQINNCILAVEDGIDVWKSCHNRADGDIPPNVIDRPNSLLDLKPRKRGRNVSEEAQLENLREIMRQNSMKEKRKSFGELRNWETDFNFYIDQYRGPRVQTLGSVDVVTFQKEQATEQRMAKRAIFYEKQAASTSQSRYLIFRITLS